ncbi:MAG: hypothetical protein KGZ40_09530 [Clostridiales bacterium]|nr:hypothetical protein [Clostridiales bacterium]
MRRPVAALIAVTSLAVTFALVGCGGGAEPAAEQPAAPAADQAQAPADPAVTPPVDLSPLEESVYEPFPRDEEALPAELASRLDAGQPLLIVLIDRSQATTDDHEAVIENLMEKYRGLISVLAFDVGKFVTQGEEGLVVVDEKISNDPVSAPVARLIGADMLDVRFTPYTVIVDANGYITWRHRGVVNDKTLEREIIRVTD